MLSARGSIPVQAFPEIVVRPARIEKTKSIHRSAELRDRNESKKVSLEASKFLAVDEHTGPTIAVGVNVNVQPGHIVNLGRHEEKARQLLEANRNS